MKHHFRARLRGYDRPGSATYIAVPQKIMAAFAPLHRVPVTAAINGVEFETSVTDVGDGAGFVVPAKMREAAGVAKGDLVVVVLEHDEESRTVDIPADLQKAMSAADLMRFRKFIYSRQKEYVEAIDAAKRPQTRLRRIEKTIQIIRTKR
ncbi:MAG: YdeI/OmpD-associated family protein [Candidatus Eremiobacteraeota bacterium]|nr:YdeI/OmpD-associated family protein [Candidatus Eremiobacteraeota bacterium]